MIGSSLISGIAGLGSGNGGKIAIRALIYYFLSTFVAVVIGIILVITIRPGAGKRGSEQQLDSIQVIEKPVVDTILDLIRVRIYNYYLNIKIFQVIIFIFRIYFQIIW